MVSPNVAKLVEGWCEMAAAKPKVKRMMFGGVARAVAKAGKTGPMNLISRLAPKTAPKQVQSKPYASPPPKAPPPAFPAKSGVGNAAAALRKLPMNPPMPGKAGPKPMQSAGRTVLGSPTVRAGMAGKSLMKKGGAVKKATKK